MVPPCTGLPSLRAASSPGARDEGACGCLSMAVCSALLCRSAAPQVPLLLELGEDERALEKAVDSGDAGEGWVLVVCSLMNTQ